jgi:hypothetical protein
MVRIKNHEDNVVGTGNGQSSRISIPFAIPWWPRFMNGDQPVGYLYKFEVLSLSEVQIMRILGENFFSK